MNHKRQLILLIILSVPLVFAVNLFTTYAVINVEVSAPFDTKSVVTYAASGKPTQKAGNTGIMIVPRTTTSLVVAQGDYIKTESKLDIPWYGYTAKKIQLRKDKNATKVAYKSTIGAQCATYNPTTDSLAYYRCGSATNLVAYKTPINKIWNNVEITKFYYPSNYAYPYMGGVIGLSYSDDIDEKSPGDIIAYDGNGRSNVFNAPEAIQDKSKFNFSSVFTNTNNPTDNRFVIVTVNGDIYIGTPNGGKNVEYYRIAAPSDYNSDYNQTLCSLTDMDVYCYRGKTAYGDISPSFDFSKVAGSQIVHYSYLNKSVDTTNFATDLFAINQFQSTASGDLYATYYKELYRFENKNGKYNIVRISQNASTIAASDKLYFTQDKGIFAVDNTDTSTAYQVFYSKNVIPRSLYAVSGKLFIIGSIPGDDSVTYAYQLNSDNDTQPGNRAIDILPMASSELPGAYLNDLVGERIFVMLDVNSSSNPAQPIKPAEIDAKKRQIIQKLSLYGSTINANNIQFAY